MGDGAPHSRKEAASLAARPSSVVVVEQPSELPQPHLLDRVVLPLAQHEVGAVAGGQDVLEQVRLVDRRPRCARAVAAASSSDERRRSGGSRTRGRGRRCAAASGSARRTSRAMSSIVRVDVDREVEEVRDEEPRLRRPRRRRLQHVQPLDDHDVGLLDRRSRRPARCRRRGASRRGSSLGPRRP